VEGAVAADQAADRRERGDRARGQDEPVVGDAFPVHEHDLPRLTVDLQHPRPEPQVDPVRLEPRRRAQGEGVGGVGPLEDGREQDAVVGRVLLVGQDGETHVRADELLGQADGGHAAADHDDAISHGPSPRPHTP
jgi:hypothetical protein